MDQKQIEENLAKINLYEPMSTEIVNIFAMGDEPMYLYAAKLIKTQKEEIKRLQEYEAKCLDCPIVCVKEEYIHMSLEIERLQKLVTDLREDFANYATSGIPNLAPYCFNGSAACVDERGWCVEQEFCKGFRPRGLEDSL